MPNKPFDASQFVATQWSSAADKAAFGNTYLHFVESEWKRSLFAKAFYNRLSNCFGHIAHYDIDGFYQTWFTRDKDRFGFLRNTLRWPCYGDPKFTYSDVERAIKHEVRARNYLALYELRAAEELRSAEISLLQRLEAKYRAPVSTSAAAPTEDQKRKLRLRTRNLFHPLQLCRYRCSKRVASRSTHREEYR